MASKGQELPPVRACLFDMDGLLIDSEEHYSEVTNTILQRYGKPNLPWSIKAQMQGRPGPQSYEIFTKFAQLPISDAQFREEQLALQRELFPKCKPLPGVEKLLRQVTNSGTQIALATSSHRVTFDIKTSHLTNLLAPFPPSQRVLGDDPRIAKGRGKPAPDIYLLALETINEELRKKGKKEISPAECLVFEDAVPGVEAGRRAGMRVIWCPHQGLLQEFKGREEDVLAGLTGAAVDEPVGEDKALANDKIAAGWPGQRGDGWGQWVMSLENFDWAKYGVKVPES